MIPKELQDSPQWCVSKNKVPLDMHALARGLEWGASNARSHSCYTSYDEAVHMGKVQNLPITIMLDSAATGFYVIDIEKECPQKMRQALLLALNDHIEYIERSLSGKGYHLAVRMTQPKALSTVKYKKWFEILSAHHCTFTGKEIDAATAFYDQFTENQPLGLWDEDVNPDDLEAKRDHDFMQALSAPLTPEELYDKMEAGKTVVIGTAADIGAYKEALSSFDGRHADLFNGLCDMTYTKTIDGDFHGDVSRWEFGYASKMHYQLQRMANDMIDAHMHHYRLELTQEQAVMLVYMALKQCLPPREKHKTQRAGLPWLLYNSQQVYIKTFEK